MTNFGNNVAVIEGEGAIFNKARIRKTALFGQVMEVVPIQCTTQAFAIKNRVIDELLWNAAVRIDIGEIELTTRL